MNTQRQMDNGKFYSKGHYVIRGRKIVHVSNGGSTVTTTKARLAHDISDLEKRLGTKIRSPQAIEDLTIELAAMREGLALAEANGL